MRTPYEFHEAIVKGIREEGPEMKTFKLVFKDKSYQDNFDFDPGQYVIVSVIGYGEAPLSISSSPSKKDHFEITFRAVGNLTNALYRMKEGDKIGIRGPYGNGWPIEELRKKDIVIVGGGVGFPPLRSFIGYVLDHRNLFGKLTLFYGARDTDSLICKREFNSWKKLENFEVLETVDEANKCWKGNVGVVTTLFTKTQLPKENKAALMCGPPIMMKFACKELKKLGFKEDEVYVSLEGRMECGMKRCMHCNIGEVFVCEDGPIFSLKERNRLVEVTEKW
jgi:sulfhydrogenase subunit gamma (sulfur reductase)